MNITQTLSLNFTQQLASHSNLAGLMSTAPSLVTMPINYVVYDLRPFDVPVFVLFHACGASAAT